MSITGVGSITLTNPAVTVSWESEKTTPSSVTIRFTGEYSSYRVRYRLEVSIYPSWVRTVHTLIGYVACQLMILSLTLLALSRARQVLNGWLRRRVPVRCHYQAWRRSLDMSTRWPGQRLQCGANGALLTPSLQIGRAHV